MKVRAICFQSLASDVRMPALFKASVMRWSVSLGVLGLLGVASTIPAAASTIGLNTGNGTSAYIITADTLNPSEGSATNVVTTLAGGWANDLTSEWIAPVANQGNSSVSEADAGSVTYQTTFALPTTGLKSRVDPEHRLSGG